MVDTYGRWTYIPDTPPEKKCDMDRLADAIYADGYEPQDLELLCCLVFNAYDEYLKEFEETSYTGMDHPDPMQYTIPDVTAFVRDSGGWKEFDYDI